MILTIKGLATRVFLPLRYKKEVIQITLHNIPPVCDENSKILILGSFPSVRSREQSFFYGHSQNRFWKVLSCVLADDEPESIEEKRSFLLKNKIALWDVIASCDIEGSADSTIRNVLPNDIEPILKAADIKMIFLNGRTAEKYYNKYLAKKINRDTVTLPSTSPANAVWRLDDLIAEWGRIKSFL